MDKKLLSEGIVVFDLEVKSKREAICKIADMLERDGRLYCKEKYIEDVWEREVSSSTAVGFLVATPHAKSCHVKYPSLAFAKLKNPIQWDDNEKVQIIFQIGVPSPGQGDYHLEIISKIFRNLVHDEFIETLLNAKNKEDIIQLLKDF